MKDFTMTLTDVNFARGDFLVLNVPKGEEIEVDICNIEYDEVDESFEFYNGMGDLQTFKDIGYEVTTFDVFLGDKELTMFLTPSSYNTIVDKILKRIK